MSDAHLNCQMVTSHAGTLHHGLVWARGGVETADITVVMVGWKQMGGKASQSWWRHEMEIFSAILALCEGNPPVTGGFPSERASNAGFGVFCDVSLHKRLHKQSSANDLRRPDDHCDVTAMVPWRFKSPLMSNAWQVTLNVVKRLRLAHGKCHKPIANICQRHWFRLSRARNMLLWYFLWFSYWTIHAMNINGVGGLCFRIGYQHAG